MQAFGIRALKLEGSALDHLSGFIHEHALAFFMAAIYLLLAFLAWVVSGGLRRKLLKGKPTPYVQPVIGIQLSGAPRPSVETFNPFPPLCNPPDYEPDGQDLD